MSWKRKIPIDHRASAFSRHLTTGLVLACLGSLSLAACAGAETGPDPGPTGGDSTTRANAPARLVKLANFDQPVEVKSAPGFPDLMFVVEQPGRVMLIRRGRKVSKPFLNVSSRIQAGGEMGLLSIAFPGDYRETNRFYIYYSAPDGDIVIEERRRQSTLVASSYRRQVIRIPHPDHDNHYGGQMHFLGDNLFFGTGDGGSGNDPENNAQNLESLLGKMIRIDPRRAEGQPYSIPPTNPFVGRAGRDEIFAIGLRNPFRWSFVKRSGEPTRMAIADVGQEDFEEVNYPTVSDALGANFGWRNHEGSSLVDGNPELPDRTDPVLSLPHPPNCSIIGGLVVRDQRLTSLDGRYVFADYCRGDLLGTRLAPDGAGPVEGLGLPVSRVTSFGEDSRRRVWLSSLGGGVYRLDPAR